MRFSLLIISIVLNLLMYAQVPAIIPYQAVARDVAGQALNNATINARFTIHDGSATGAVVWQELQTVTTTSLGLFTVQLGSIVALTAVNWANGDKFMQVEIDLGQGFVDIGTQQMLSVPYALHAGGADVANNGFSNVSAIGDTLFMENGSHIIIQGISMFNRGGLSGVTEHSCGVHDVHNPALVYGSMTDQEGNVYKTITIGTQEWMAENLNTSIFRNGEPIPNVTDDPEWEELNIGAWCYYNNDPSYSCPHGKLYNWYTCVDGRQLCPTGWHVPSDIEWIVLTNFLGGSSIAGAKMKSAGTATNSWFLSTLNATNSCGFSGLPGGYSNGGYQNAGLGTGGWWWSSSGEDGYQGAWFRSLDSDFRSSTLKTLGFSVRCLRD